MLLLLAVMGAVAHASDLAGVELEGDSPPTAVVQAKGEPVLVPACRGVVWEVFDGDAARFVPVPGEACKTGATPSSVGTEPVRYEPDVDLPKGAIVRAVVVVARDCRADEAIADAACEVVEVLESQTTTVR